ncbi:MAG: peptidoglycan-binding protein [Actinomycetota bacterium]|nr:peptidoglycan-binding protein [Actinomycetota bacterium]
MLQLGRRPVRTATLTLALLLAAPGTLTATAAPATSRPSATTVLAKRGDRSATVAAAQRLLVAVGVPLAGGVDGIYGAGTTAAVTEFQRRRGLPQTGTIDVGTATLLGLVPPTPLLARGARGAAVTQLQQRLIAVGIKLRGGADGYFGTATAAAVSAFQASKGIAASGALDAGTDAVLAQSVAALAPAAPAPAVATDGTLAPGSRGTAVAEVQRLLAAAGFAPRGGSDGIFGNSTTSKVKAFQSSRGLPPNGIVDSATRSALTAAQPTGNAVSATGATPAPATGDGSPLHLDFFPLPATCNLRDSFGHPRSGGRKHEGIDILAARGTPIYAVKAGRISAMGRNYAGSLAGNALTLTMPDGTYFFHAHLDHYPDGLTVGSNVAAGAIIGYVGSTGNAGTPHLHLEVHPQGGAAVNPYPLVRSAVSC